MTDRFGNALAIILDHEGGYVDHPQDPGGATNLGITIATLSDWLDRPATKGDVRALTPASVRPIYRARYWQPVRASDLPAGLDLAMFDYAVNSGPSRAARELQRILGVTADGVVGPITIAAARSRDTRRLIEALCDARLLFLRGLPHWGAFGRGWERRVTHTRKIALQWAEESDASMRISPEPVADEPEAERSPWGVILRFLARIFGGK